MDDGLRELAAAYGVATEYWDWRNEHVHVAADTLAALVTSLGAEARKAYDGIEGIAEARQFQPQVVLLDLGMPTIDGYEVCRRLRGDAATRHAYIVAVSGWGQPQDRARALAAGFDAHLTKPPDPTRLQELLRQESRPGGGSAAHDAP